jgi:hypothetical protein
VKYSVLIIESADGIRYDNLLKADLDRLIELSLEQNFSVIVRKYEKEE